MSDFDFDLREFTSGDAVAATGVSMELQRNWRRYGFLKQESGHARYDFFEIAEMWVLQAVGKFGVGPKVAKSYSADAAKLIAWHALTRLDAYQDLTGHPLGAFSPGLEKTGAHWQVPFSPYLKPNKNIGIGRKPTEDTQWPFRGRWLADRIIHGTNATEPVERLYLIFENGTAVALNDTEAPMRLEVPGAFVCLPLNRAATWLLQALNAPIARVTWRGDRVEVPA